MGLGFVRQGAALGIASSTEATGVATLRCGARVREGLAAGLLPCLHNVVVLFLF